MHQQKSQLRDDIEERLSRLSAKDRTAESRSICRRLTELLPQKLVTICAYVPLKNEVDINSLLRHLLEKDYSLFLPRFEGGKLAFRRTQNLSELERGPLGNLESLITNEELDPKVLSHVLIPGRAFDRSGGRLGRGNGGYDHWIDGQRKENPETVFWGVCFECQLTHEIPMEAHDERVDAVVTARGFV